jgi:hypothetical protein
MKISGLLALILFSCIERSSGWGFWGHQTINRMACFTLPKELFGFYKSNIDYITVHAVDPDKRRYSDSEEPPRHFIDADHYGECPFDTLPIYWKDAIEKFGEDSLKKYGIVPWYIPTMYYRLINAFKKNDPEAILYYSANIGHYVADAHVPLHCTENYNGQLTGQSGIHGFWESRLPELFGDDYDFFMGRAEYIDNVALFSWEVVKESFAGLDSVLTFERNLNNKFEASQKYSFELRGAQTVQVYSYDYSKAFHQMLGGQVERRLQSAILDVGSIWYTAWVDAGMPALDTNFQKPENLSAEAGDEETHH